MAILREDNLTKVIPLDESKPSNVDYIGIRLESELEDALTWFLQTNKNIFAWKPSNMPGIPRDLIEHTLHINKSVKPVRQRLRCFAKDRKVIRKEITWLLATGFIMEVHQLDWLANRCLSRKRTMIGGCAWTTQI